MNQLCKLPPLLEHISQANCIRNVQHGTRPYVSPTFCFVHFCRCARAQASAIFDVMLRSVVNACDKTANAICFLTMFFLIWESNSDSTKMSYKISMPMFVSVSVQRGYCYLGYTVYGVYFLLPECFSIISLDFMLSFIFARCSNRIKIETTLINPTYCVQCLLASFALRIEFISIIFY